MNELQIVMIIVGMLVIAGIFLVHRTRSERRSAEDAPTRPAHREMASTPQRRHNRQWQDEEENSVHVVEENGRKVIIDETLEPEQSLFQRNRQFVRDANAGAELRSEPAAAERDDAASRAQANHARTDAPSEAEKAQAEEKRVFAIMVLGMHYYPLETLREALAGCHLEYDPESRIYVRRNAYGKVYIRVANALNPGTFPPEGERAEDFQSPGVALIMTLPTVVPAPRAMDEMIRIARRLSQRLDARLYDEKRSRLNESDLRNMRTAAVELVSKPVQ